MSESLFAHVLVPLDGSQLAESVLPAVALLARQLGTQITLLHILEQRPPTTIHGERHLTDQAEAESYLKTIAERLRAEGAIVETHAHGAREGDVARCIGDHIHDIGATFVALCTHGSRGLRGLLYGRIAQQVLRYSTCPILLVPASIRRVPPLDFSRILAPLDGTAAHELALPAAIALAQAFAATLRLTLVIPTLTTLSDDRSVPAMLLPTTMTAILDLAQQGAVDYLDRIKVRCNDAHIAVAVEVLRGDPATAVLNDAERFNAGLIVMASHGRTGMDALLAGSVVPRLTEQIDRPLLLVRADEADNAGD